MRSRQSGTALLVLLALVGVVFGVLLITTLSGTRAAVEREQRTALALGKARDALIGRAAADVSRPGSLPCPDLTTNNPSPPNPAPGNVPDDGIADLFAGTACPSYVGRLPWATLDLPDLRDGEGERLWYALSPKYRDHAAGLTLNSETAGELTVTGTHAATDVVAIIFSPGSPVGTQDRLAGANAVANYLEGDNANGGVTYESGPATAAFNDQVLVITRGMLMPVVEQRVARQARRCLQSFAQQLVAGAPVNRYPFAAPLTDLTNFDDGGMPATYYGRIPLILDNTNAALGTLGWQQDEPEPAGTPCFQATWWGYWKELLFYRVAPAYAPGGAGACGACLTVNGITNVKFAVIVAGRVLTNTSPSQATRLSNKSNQQMYLETAPAPPANTNNAFGLLSGSLGKRALAITTGPSGDFNDRVECVHESGAWPCN